MRDALPAPGDRPALGDPVGAGPAPVVVIGVGNTARGDDAAGRAVAARVRRLLADRPGASGIRVVESDGEASRVLDAWAGAEAAILIDASAPSGSPGCVQRFDAVRDPLPARLAGSTHAFGPAEAVALGRVLDRFPASMVVYAIEGRSFAPGDGLSPEVEQAVERTARRVAAEAVILATHGHTDTGK